MNKRNLIGSKAGAYGGLIFVIFIWGLSPLITIHMQTYFSPTIRIAMGTFFCAISMILISIKHLNLLNRQYFKIAVPTGLCLAAADISQKVGLTYYESPSHYAFLENLSVVVVPILMFLLIKKKPNALTIISAILCLASCFILTGMLTGGATFNLLGDTLFALAGIFYGINIAVTGIHAKNLFVPIYLAIQIATEAIISLISAFVFDFTGIEPLRFAFDAKPILMNIGFVLVSLTLGWLIRTWAMKKVDPTVVAVMMPFSATVTVIASISMGKDTISPELIIGGVLGLVAIILSGLGDREPKKKKE